MMANSKEAVLKDIDELCIYLQDEHPASEILDYLRATSLPFIPCLMDEINLAERFRLSSHFLSVLGEANLPLSVAICMSQYSLYVISALPGEHNRAIKADLLRTVVDNRWLVAVSSTDDFIRHKNDPNQSVMRCERLDDGSLVCNGKKNFQSNATHADILIFSGIVNDADFRLFVTPLKDVDGIHMGPPLFEGVMEDADTRAIEFKNVSLPESAMLGGGSTDMDDTQASETESVHAFSRAVFAVMVLSPYIGGAQRAMSEAAKFLDSVHIDETPLSQHDGFIVDLGRQSIRLRVCQDLLAHFSASLNLIEMHGLAHWLTKSQASAKSTKHFVTESCERIVLECRNIVGTRALLGNAILGRLASQVGFGILHPEVNAKVEREFGQAHFSHDHRRGHKSQ